MMCYVTATINAQDAEPMRHALAARFPDCFLPIWAGDSVAVQVDTTREAPIVSDVVAAVESYGYTASVYAAGLNGVISTRLMGRCAVSGGYYLTQDLRTMPDGRAVHLNVYQREIFRCPGCAADLLRSDGVEGPYGQTICARCVRQECGTCYDCGRIEWDSDLHHDEIDDERICSNCRQERRGDEFDGRHKSFAATNTFGSARNFGIELETNAGTASDQFAFGAKEDGSIDGWEFVSHKLRGDAGLAETEQFMASFDGVRIGDNCGFHLHFSVQDLTDAEKYGTYAAYLVLQDWFFNQVNRTRQSNSYCRKLDVRASFADAREAVRTARTFASFSNYWERYHWLNVGAVHKHNTFEIRLHHAVKDFEPVKRWVILNLRFVRACREHCKIEPGDTLATFTVKAEKALDWALEYFGESVRPAQPATAEIAF